MNKIVSLQSKKVENTQWPLDCCLERINEFDEILLLAKVSGEERYVRFSSALKNTFWWIGALEAMKRNIMEESLTIKDQ